MFIPNKKVLEVKPDKLYPKKTIHIFVVRCVVFLGWTTHSTERLINMVLQHLYRRKAGHLLLGTSFQ